MFGMPKSFPRTARLERFSERGCFCRSLGSPVSVSEIGLPFLRFGYPLINVILIFLQEVIHEENSYRYGQRQ